MEMDNSVKILLIGDQAGALAVLRAMVRDTLPESIVVTAANGPGGIDLAAAEDPDLILLDGTRPDTDAFSICRRLTNDARLKDIPVLCLMPSAGDPAERFKALEAGADGFLVMPPDPASVTAQFRVMARLKAAKRSLRLEKEQLEALRESLQTFRDLFEKSADAILLIDKSGVFVECNQAALDLLRMPREAFLNRPPVMISPEFQPDGRRSAEAAQEMIDQAYAKGLHRFDWTCVDAAGGEFIVEVSLMPITINGRTMLHTTWRDITARKRAEKALQERDDRLQRQNDALLALMSRGTLFQAGLQQAIAEITEVSATLLGTERVSVWMYGDDYAEIRCIDLYRHADHTHSSGEALRSKDFPAYTASHREGGVIAAVDVQADPRTREIPAAYFGEHDIRSLLDAPVWVHGRLGGILSFEQTKSQRSWIIEDERLATNMAALLSLCFEIDERRRTEKTLESERNRLAGIIEGTRVGTWEWNVQTGETVFNERWAGIVGYTLDEISPVSIETWMRFAHPDDLKKSNELLERHFRGELDYYEFESRMRHRNGEWVWVLDRGKVMRWTEEGKPLLMMGTHQDVSDRKRAEDALRESESRFSTAFRASPALLVLSEIDTGKFIDVNDRWLQTLGHTREETIGHTSYELGIWEDPDVRLKMGEIIRRDGSFREVPVRFITKTGRRCDVLWSAETILLDGEKIMLSLLYDYTDRKRAEEALRESEAKLSALFASMTEMVVLHEVVFDEAGEPVNYRITDCNAAYTRITGIRREDAVGRLAHEVYGTPDPPYLEEFTRVGISGEPYHYETYFPPMDKHFSISVVSPGQNRFATITTDISETKRIQAVIDAKNKELEQLVYVASHDLRSPLVNVDGFSRELDYSLKELAALFEGERDREALEKTLRAQIPDMEHSIARIRASAGQMDRLLKGLLRLSRQGRTALLLDDIDMNDCLDRLAASFAFTMKAQGVGLSMENLPPCHGDAVQLTQVFANLVDNAIKYGDPERPLRIRITGALEAGRAVYRVEDNGVGIAENHLEHVFELFHRLEPGKTEGEGLGLTIARQALSRMYGEIRVESEPGRGSVFIVSMPPARK